MVPTSLKKKERKEILLKLLGFYSLLEHKSYLKFSVKVQIVLGALKKIKEFSAHSTLSEKKY